MTDLSQLPLPAELVAHLRKNERQTTVTDHRVRVSREWWHRELSTRGLPVGTVSVGPDTMSRGEIFTIAHALGEDQSEEVMLNVLWHALSWGTGPGNRNNARRLDAIAADRPAALQVLRAATDEIHRPDGSAVGRCEQAYAAMYPGGRTAIRFVGPAFFTKYLYFVGAGAADHPAPIMDDRVAGALSTRHGWTSLGTGGGWPAGTYRRYCTLLDRWAHEATDAIGPSRQVCVDEIERWLFDSGPRRAHATQTG